MVTRVPDYGKVGETTLSRSEKTSAEVMSAVYGGFVELLLEDSDGSIPKVNEELRKFGQGIGQRIADEVLSKFGLAGSCTTFSEVCEAISKLGLRLYLGSITETVHTDSSSKFLFRLTDSSLSEFLEPESGKVIRYNELILGCVIGALAQLGWTSTGQVITDLSVGDNSTMISLELVSESK
jgi:Transport protein particle (TRAPP) component